MLDQFHNVLGSRLSSLLAASVFACALAGWQPAALMHLGGGFDSALHGIADAAEKAPPVKPADKPPEPDKEKDAPAPGKDAAKTPAAPSKKDAAEPDDGRNPFMISAKLLEEVLAIQKAKAEAAAKAKAPKAPPEPVKPPEVVLPGIRMTGVMIVGDQKMATAEVEQLGVITLLKGEKVVLRLKNRAEPFKFTVQDIDERYLTIITEDGIEIRALFK